MPSFITSPTIERFASDVSMRTGVLFPASRILASIVGPSISGMVTSSRTRS